MKTKKLSPCPCGQPAIEMSCNVPRCATCRQRELTYAGLNCHGEHETNYSNAFAKYKHFFTFNPPDYWQMTTDKIDSLGISSFNH